MKKVFEKHETLFCILLIVIYLASNSVCIQLFGQISLAGVIINALLSLFLLILIYALKGGGYYGLTIPKNVKEHLYFIPLLLILSVNLWNGININNSTGEIALHILNMLGVGFIEEIIFRGFLFKMMAKSNMKSAVIVSAVTFGAGHIVNLLNGAQLIPTLLQVCYAISIGYLFVVIFCKSGSLLPCIITHCVMNSLSVFNANGGESLYVSAAFLTAVPLIYALYINKKVKQIF